jgi:hypothetical protein
MTFRNSVMNALSKTSKRHATTQRVIGDGLGADTFHANRSCFKKWSFDSKCDRPVDVERVGHLADFGQFGPMPSIVNTICSICGDLD